MKNLRLILFFFLLIAPFASITWHGEAHQAASEPAQAVNIPASQDELSPPLAPAYAITPIGWHIEIIDAIEPCDDGISASLVWHSNDVGEVAYHAACSGVGDHLIFAHQQYSMGSKIWVYETLDEVGAHPPLKFIDMALDENGTPYISYFDYEGPEYLHDLHVAWPGESDWIKLRVMDNGSEGASNSIAVGGGQGYVSYYDSSAGNLLFVRFTTSSGLYIPPVLVATNSGSHSSIALRSDHQPRIAYADSTSPYHLSYAWTYDSGDHWSIAPLVDGSIKYPSLAIDNNNWPVISYYDVGESNLAFIRYGPSGWGSAQQVDGASADVGQYTSLALNSDQLPWISYYDVTNKDLKFAQQFANGQWSVMTIDSGGDVGQYSSLAIDPHGYPHIAYYDKTHTDLMHVWWIPPVYLPLIRH
jgi:hypothetical protein